MVVSGHLTGGPGELVAVDLPPGEPWLDIVADLWWRGVSLMPVDHRLASREKRALLDLARPAVLVTADGTTVFSDSAPADPVDAAVIIATSGTAGQLRMAELSRGALEAALSRSNGWIGAAGDDPWLAVLSPAHIGGFLVYLRHGALGSPVAAHPRFEPDALDATGSAFASLVPTMVRWLVDAGARLSGVTLVVGGGPLDPATKEAAHDLGARVFQTYGLTESAGGVVYDGSALPGVELRVDDDGLIEISGPTLMTGYRFDPDATARAFTVDGWLRTGDVGALHDGALSVSGRADDLIRTGEEKVWPDEVEVVLRSHSKVAEVAVAGRPDPEWGQHVAAWVVPRTLDDPPTLDELREHTRDELARFKAPRELFLVAELPKTRGGKVRRRDLPPG